MHCDHTSENSALTTTTKPPKQMYASPGTVICVSFKWVVELINSEQRFTNVRQMNVKTHNAIGSQLLQLGDTRGLGPWLFECEQREIIGIDR
jgi:hypothetical protein